MLFEHVHDNPGEKRFDSKFRDPALLAEFGYTGKVSRHINCAVGFESIDPDIFPENSEDKTWLIDSQKRIDHEIEEALSAGIDLIYHIDIFVLPRKLVQKYKAEICDENGHISLFNEKILEIHRIFFDELFSRFPNVAGIMIRVGETYLHDAPYHVGNGPLTYEDDNYDKKVLIRLIDFLREEVCVRHNRRLFFRTWDTFSFRFHANKEYYLSVTDQIEPHENLYFSLKHTGWDFWRYVPVNPCIAQGRHRQIIEIQCQREYEGKNAYPNYIARGVLNGFPEVTGGGIASKFKDPLVAGLFTWSRGGGWSGPYVKDEFFSELHISVFSEFYKNPDKSEEQIFLDFARNRMKLSDTDARKFRRIMILSEEAVRKGIYCEAFQDSRTFDIYPNNLWVRDDYYSDFEALGLSKIFDDLYENNRIEEALAEKSAAAAIWDKMKSLFEEMIIPDQKLSELIGVSIEYGRRLYSVFEAFWLLKNEQYRINKGIISESHSTKELEKIYDSRLKHYNELEKSSPYCATLFSEKNSKPRISC